jgi:hypothetical protein
VTTEPDHPTERWRNDPATEKQKEKLRFFGCTWDEGITKGQAHDAIDECVRQFPERDREYYNRPATEDQLAKLRAYLAPDGEEPEDYAEDGSPLTYGQAKELISECEFEMRAAREEDKSPASEGRHNPPTLAQIKSIKESGFQMDPSAVISEDALNVFLRLEGQPPREEDMQLLVKHGITLYQGDAFAAYALAVLIKQFESMGLPGSLGYLGIAAACIVAQRDPAYLRPTITVDKSQQATFAWPKRKLKEWYRLGAGC